MKHKHLLKSMLSVMLLSLLTIVAISCGDDEEDPMIYTVTVIPSEGGEADASCYEVILGEKVTLTATPESGYQFKCWMLNGKEVSTENPYTVVVNKNIVYRAKFVKGEDSDNNEDGEDESEGEGEEIPDKTYQVSVVYGEGGTATANKTQVGYKGQVTLTANPNVYYKFVSWTVNGSEVSTNATYTAIVIANTEFKANFVKNSYYPTGTENGKYLVDLGLPSGLKWATCNVGATTPEGYGDHFAWGETEPKDYYDWSTYKYCNGSFTTLTKYCTDSSYGTVDNKSTLELTDDAARVNWGGKWRMPTQAEYNELKNTSNCTWTWTTQNGVNGYEVTSKKNGNSIFLPAAGYCNDGVLYRAGGYGDYWSSSLRTSVTFYAYSLYFGSSDVRWNGLERCGGRSVRAVCE